MGSSTSVTVAAYDRDEIIEADYVCIPSTEDADTTTEDHVYIQAANDFLSGAYLGGTVNLSRGTFNLGGSVYIDSYITLSGEGTNTIIDDPTSTEYRILTRTSALNVRIADFKVTNTGSSAAGIGVSLVSANYSTVDNIYFDDAGNNLVYVSSATSGVRILNCTMDGFYQYGIRLYEPSDVIIDNCILK